MGRRTATGCLLAEPLKQRAGHFTDLPESQRERKEQGKKAFKKEKKNRGTSLIFFTPFSEFINSLTQK